MTGSLAGRRCVYMLIAALAPLAAQARERVPVGAALDDLRSVVPQVRVEQTEESFTLYGTALAHGVTPEAAAEAFRLAHAETLGVASEDLVPVGADGLRSGPLAEPMVFDPAAGTSRFSLVRYQQMLDGVRVYDGEVRMLVLNRADHPVTWVGSSAKDLGDFAVTDLRSLSIDAAQQAAMTAAPAVDRFTEPETVIWVSRDKQHPGPVLALTFIAEAGVPEFGEYEKWRFVCDAQTGAVLSQESKIYTENITGNVSGMATPGDVAEECATEVLTPFPDAQVQAAGGPIANTDINGNYVATNAGTTAVNVTASIRGTYFRVEDAAAANAVPSSTQSVTPPGPANFVFNSANTDELQRAQVNGYLSANGVRDYVLSYVPDYPVIASQTNFRVTVNRTDLYCPGNAWYDGSGLNFCRSSSGQYPNTAFTSVAHHEYGHHLVESAGSGQDQYGEGMGDCVAVLMSDDPRLGLGFFWNQCSSPLRNADNAMQYPCTGEAHSCAGLLSGCVWDLRDQLLATNPSNYRDILSVLTLESIRLHVGATIARDITNAFLTLDDDDANLGNGTPHSTEILAAFGAHNMVPLPPPANDACANAIAVCPGTPVSGSTADATAGGTASCGTSNASPDVFYSYTPQTSGSATFSLCTGTAYDSVLSVSTACSGGTELGCDDDGCGGQAAPSSLTATVQAGVKYIIRVSGWQGAAGPFTLTVTGPACAPTSALSITLPNGPPASLPPNVSSTMTVRIQNALENYVPGSGQLRYRYNGGAYASAALTPLSGNDYTATFPAGPNCGDSPEFYVTAQGSGGTTVSFPSTAPASVLTAPVGVFSNLFTDAFETDQGWTVGDTGDNATTGQWTRNDPQATTAQPEDDHTAAPGVNCWVTDYRAGTGVGSFDVDGGKTTLKSPTLNLAGAGSAKVSYWRWYSNNQGSNPNTNTFTVDISNNNGSSWTNVETVGPAGTEAGGGWVYHEFTLSSVIAPTSQVRMRFVANDATGAVVEAAVDDFTITQFSCTPAASCSDGILNQGEARIDCGGPCPACECTSDAACSDGQFCNGAELCDPFGDCAPGTDPCTLPQTCDENSDSCVSVPACAAADVNCDGTVDGSDILSIRAPGTWNATGAPGFTAADVNQDGAVNGSDILSVRSPGVWNTTTGPCTCSH